MAELDQITETLRRQKDDLTEFGEERASRSSEAAELVEKIQDLRRRAEETQRRLAASVRESKARKK